MLNSKTQTANPRQVGRQECINNQNFQISAARSVWVSKSTFPPGA
jgi:hypothetical protein